MRQALAGEKDLLDALLRPAAEGEPTAAGGSHLAEPEAHAAASGGWTTQRHHAVPTTDIPIHESPELLGWFNRALRDRIAPLLAFHFGELLPSPSAVRVHDAFLVRYSAEGGQAHLPMHTDESMLSLTIVLNEQFTGGGTFFEHLGEDALVEIPCSRVRTLECVM